MMLGEIPGLALDRTGIALLGAILMVAGGALTPEAAWLAIDVPTMALLFGLMVVSAQFRLGGFYAEAVRRIALRPASPERLLMAVVLSVGALSALLANDIVCLAMTPVLVEACARRGLHPVPFLLGLAGAANVGSAATLIGNPPNMLIGQTLGLSFAGYLLDGGIPALLGLGVVWWAVAREWRGRFSAEPRQLAVDSPAFDTWQTQKGLLVLSAVVVAFLLAPWPREIVALVAAGVLLTSRRMTSRDVLGLVDWQLLVLFIGLFVVSGALAASGLLASAFASLASAGVDATHPTWLFVLSVGLSNLVSNVPAVLLLLPAAEHPQAGPVLALSSTLAGNLIVVGSVANIIVVDRAARLGVAIDWRTHARVGIPMTLGTLAIAAAWLWLRT
jgi:Na+/H+ antiporter NhaD/arsenite permease-like protein